MTEFQKTKWKYSTIGLLAVLAVGFSLPQAFAHVTNVVQHMLSHIFEDTQAIKSKTQNLPTDPASQSAIEAALSGTVSDVGPTESIRIIATQNPDDGETSVVNILEFDSEKTYSGHISGGIGTSPGSSASLVCLAAGGSVLLASSSSGNQVNQSFACDELSLMLTDEPDVTDADAFEIRLLIQYISSSDVTLLLE